jgi:histone H3/H4
MMKILSAEMASIPKQAIKKMVQEYFGLQITDDGAAAIARLLERRARKISKFAVKNAKKESREKVTKKDIQEYVLKVGSDED